MWPQEFEENGFAILPAVLTHGEVDSVAENLSCWTLGRSRAGLRHVLRNPCIGELAEDRRLLAIASHVLGSNAFPFRATLFDKSADANWLVVWHQDTALPLQQRRDVPGWGPWSVKDGVSYAHAPATALSKIVALRVHLDDSHAGNGPLRILPGTHTAGVLTDEEIGQCARQVAPITCLVERGGILAMSPLIVHSSSKSHAQTQRRVLHIEYAASIDLADALQLARA
jgi:ectoine hydroxylase-related dioxygenase (phytanoyl-CoA dioxygenase family)